VLDTLNALGERLPRLRIRWSFHPPTLFQQRHQPVYAPIHPYVIIHGHLPRHLGNNEYSTVRFSRGPTNGLPFLPILDFHKFCETILGTRSDLRIRVVVCQSQDSMVIHFISPISSFYGLHCIQKLGKTRNDSDIIRECLSPRAFKRTGVMPGREFEKIGGA
jgi:hypothetical protein